MFLADLRSPATQELSEGSQSGQTLAKGPDWELVFFDVDCPRCGHGLRGLTEPLCPACGLEFDWNDALPLEQLKCLQCGYYLFGLRDSRCPECGQPFRWQDVLDHYRRRQKPLFEYHWRTMPFRSWLWTWWRALRPWKLWRIIDIHDPPSEPGLAILLVTATFFWLASSLAVAGFAWWIIAELEVLSIPPQFRPAGFGAAFASGYGYANSPGLIGDSVFRPRTAAILAVMLAGGLAAGFGSLLTLRQSMRLCKVRSIHIARAFFYSLISLFTGLTLLYLAIAAVDIGLVLLRNFNVTWWKVRDRAGVLISCVLVAIAFWFVMSIALAYRRYIRMKHAWWVAILTQAIAFLVMLAVPLVLSWLLLSLP